MFRAVRTLDVPLPDHVCLDVTRSEALDIALTQIVTGDRATVVHFDVHLADLFSGVVAALPTFSRAAWQIATQDLAVVAAVAAAMVRFGALEGAVVTTNSTATIARPRAFDVASVALTIDDTFIKPLATAVVAATRAAASCEEQSKTAEKMSRESSNSLTR